MKTILITFLIAFFALPSLAIIDTIVDGTDTTFVINIEEVETVEIAEIIEEEEYQQEQDAFIELPAFQISQSPMETKDRGSRRKSKKSARKTIRCEERMRAGMEAFHRKKYSRAINLLSVVRNECSSEMDEPDSIYFFLGLSYMHGKKFEDARIEFRTIIEEFPLSEFIERTHYLIAYSSFKDAPIIQRDNRLLRRAEREFSAFISAYPNSEWTDSARVHLDSITDRLLEREILIAEFYEIIRKHESAVIYYEIMLEEYIGHRRIPEIRLRLARSLIAAKRFAEAEKQLAILENEHLFQSEIEQLRRRKISDKRKIKRR